MAEDVTSPVNTAADVEGTPQGVVKRWLAELDIADDTEKDWRKTGDEIWKLYKSKSPKANSFNILWSNTETLRPALYNSTPHPDVRRRFGDADPVGKIASQVLTRALTYSIDIYDFDFEIKKVALDALLPGRGVARIKYVPVFDSQDVVIDEGAPCEHVDWDDFRRGPGTTWSQVPWVAFRHNLQYDDLVKQFGEEIAAKVPLTETVPSEKTDDENVKQFLKTAEAWEIWDKVQKKVIFVCKGFAEMPLATIADPLRLQQFLPVPRPLYAIEDTTTLVPDPLYKRYEIQAEELNKVSRRIDRIVAALKVRGAYSAHLSEVKKVIEADDNAMIPIENASEVANMGGLDKAIWIMPIDKLAMVLEQLYISREKTIQAIYEITGLGDIMRGVSNPHETLGAQQLKSQWGSLRLQNLQRELQRFIRDLLRLMGEVMGEHFSVETLQTITGIQLPSTQDKQHMQLLLQQSQAPPAPPPVPQPGPPAAPGQPPQPGPPAPVMPPAPPQMPPGMGDQIKKALAMPTWDDIKQLLSSDKMRMYRIDIETDSTVAETIDHDASEMQDTLKAVTSMFMELGPAIQAGYMTIDVAKQLALSLVRISKCGQAVEDAIEQMQQPPPAPPPVDNSVQVAQVKADSDQQVKQAQLAADGARAQAQAQLDAATVAHQEEMKQQTATMQANLQEKLAAMNAATQLHNAQMIEEAKSQRELIAQQLQAHSDASKTMFEGAVQIIVAEIAAKQKAEAAEAAAEREVVKAESSEG